VDKPLDDKSRQTTKQRSKLDYIIDFMRANKLTKFCDLFFAPELSGSGDELGGSGGDELRALRDQLEGLAQFTLFVPTDEALGRLGGQLASQLWPGQAASLSAEQRAELVRRRRDFIMAHATAELVVPPLLFGARQSAGAQTVAGSGQSSGGEQELAPSRLLSSQQDVASGRWTSGRAPHRVPAPSSAGVAFSLAGGQLRVVASPLTVEDAARTGSGNGTGNEAGWRLLVNGASVLGGQSQALQEPHNASATYAVVHLLDGALWPAAQLSLMGLVERRSGQFGKLVRLARDPKLVELLEQSREPQALTLLLPSDEGLTSAPSRLFEQLETNVTLLRHFLRAHLVEGVYLGAQLAAAGQPRLLASLGGRELRVEAGQSAGGTLSIDGVPVLERDLLALNGVAHLLARPLVDPERFPELAEEQLRRPSEPLQLDSSPSESAATLLPGSNAQRPNSRPHQDRTLSSGSNQDRALSSRTQQDGAQNSRPDTQLEREGAPSEASQRVRSQRSGALAVERNNRDFYRPSAAPANLQLAEPADARPQGELLASPSTGSGTSAANASGSSLGAGPAEQQPRRSRPRQDQGLASSSGALSEASSSGGSLSSNGSSGVSLGGSSTASDLFDAERYKVVLNAAIRQQLREQRRPQTLAPESSSSASSASEGARARPGSVFVYDRPLSEAASLASATGDPLAQLAATQWQNATSARLSGSGGVQSGPSGPSGQGGSGELATASLRAQRLLKFQAEDARASPGQRPARKSLKWPPAYDLVGEAASSPAPGQRLLGKTAAPPSPSSTSGNSQLQQQLALNGCAFYDTECKRLFAKLVRLPAKGDRKQPQSVPREATRAPQGPPTTPQLNGQMFDSTFGETTTSASTSSTLSSSTSSPPNAQALPAWDQRDLAPTSPAGRGASSPSGSGELSRLRLGTTTLSAGNLTAVAPNAQVLLVPVKMFQDASVTLPNGGGGGANQMGANLSSGSSSVRFSSARERHQLLDALATQPLRSSNLSAFDTLDYNWHHSSPAEVAPAGSGAAKQPGAHARRIVRLHSMAVTWPQPQTQSQIQTQTQTQAEQQTRWAAGELGAANWPPRLASRPADILVTSAKLAAEPQLPAKEARPPAFQRQQVAEQLLAAAALPNQRRLPSGGGRLQLQADQPAGSSSTSGSNDFFQNRTIAEIMEDSGLRIDGQQVTFGRLRECLERARLLEMVAQPSGGPLTIFMPTDSAFQRLVQQQAILQQQQSRAPLAPGSRLSARLVDPTRRSMLPLVARAPPELPAAGTSGASIATSSSSPAGLWNAGGPSQRLQAASAGLQGGATSGTSLEPLASGESTLALGNRLTLDCAAPQVRQLLLDHLSGQLVSPKQLDQDRAISSLSGRRLLLSSVPQKKIVVVDGQPVIAATRAKNGMVYVVNKFLNVSAQMPNVVDLLDKQDQLSTFNSYLTFSKLADRLKRGEYGSNLEFIPNFLQIC